MRGGGGGCCDLWLNLIGHSKSCHVTKLNLSDFLVVKTGKFVQLFTQRETDTHAGLQVQACGTQGCCVLLQLVLQQRNTDPDNMVKRRAGGAAEVCNLKSV